MALIKLQNSFSIIPEGVHVFRIYEVVYDADFGKMHIKLINAKGITHTERFSLLNKDGSPNEKTLAAFSYFAKTAMCDSSLEEIDPDWLVNKYIKSEIKHTQLPSRDDPSKIVTFANMGDKWEATGFEETPTQKAMTFGTVVAIKTAPVVEPDLPIDLDSALD